MQPNYPIWSVKSVQAHADYTLIVDFKNGEKKLYDCKPLLNDGVFKALQNKIFFYKLMLNVELLLGMTNLILLQKSFITMAHFYNNIISNQRSNLWKKNKTLF